MKDEDIRKFARLGALEMCRRAVTEFPDILAELNALTLLRPLPPAKAWSKTARVAAAARMKKYWAAKKRSK